MMENMRNTRGNQIVGLRLALGHQARVGKDTLADYMVLKYGFKKYTFAEGVYDIVTYCQRYLNVKIEKDPIMLQFIGVGLRDHYGDDIWVKRVLKSIEQADPNANIIVSDMRFPNEMNALKDAGFTTIKIIREDRPIDRDPLHISETALESASFDYTILNNGSISDYLHNIDMILFSIMEGM